MFRKKIWFGLIAILVLGGAGFYLYSQNLASVAAQSDEEAEVQTAVARVGDIVVSATGAGSVIAAEELTSGFSTSGILTELLVKVGSEVVADDVLARIDDTDAQQALVNAQLQYQQAAMQTDASVTTTGVSYDEISVAQAQISLEAAQAALDDLLNWEADPDEVALAEANLTAAEASYNSALGQASASSASIAVSGISVDQAERDLADAQAAYDTAYDPGRDWELNDPRTATALENERERTADSLLRAQESLQIAQLNYNSTVASSSSSGPASAQSNLLSAQQALDAALNGPTEDEIEAAETTVRQAELSLQQALLNQEANEISLTQAALNLQTAEEAVRELSDGEYAVFVMENGEPQLRFVEVGIMDFTYAQILSGVEAGEEVTTGILQTQSE